MVKGFIKNGAAFLAKRQTSILSAAWILMATTLFSAILGLVRYRLLSTYFGDSEALGVFFLADRIPNFIFSILISGVFASVFIPVFKSRLRSEERAAWHLAAQAINFILLVFFVIVTILFVFSSPIAHYISAGKLDPSQLSLMVALLRIMLFSQLLLILSTFMTGILHSYQRFFLPALAPILYNLGIISFIVLFSKELGVFAPTLGMVFGAFLHFIIQLPLAYRLGYRFEWSLDWRNSDLQAMVSLMKPRLLGQFAPEFGRLLEANFATFISVSSNVFLNFAQQLQQFPVSLFGIAIAQAAFPTLSDKAQEESLEEFKETFIASFHQILFFIAPAMFLIIVLRIPFVRLAFGTHRFDWSATILTAYTLAYFGIGLFAQSLVHLLARCFYALHDTKTPLKAGLLMIVINVALSFYFVRSMGLPVWSLALSFSIAVIAQMGYLLYKLDKIVGKFDRWLLFFPVIKMFTAALVSGVLTYVLFKILDRSSWGRDFSFGPLSLPTSFYQIIIDTNYTVNLIFFTLIVGSFGLAMYLLLAYLMDVKEVRLLLKLSRKLRLNRLLPTKLPF
jgi:putative peptidoglycan lipid II flippase